MGGGKKRALETADQGLQFRHAVVFAGKVFTMASSIAGVADCRGSQGQGTVAYAGGDWQWNGFWGTHAGLPHTSADSRHIYTMTGNGMWRDKV